MKSQFTKERVGKFLSYYKPHWKIFAVDMGCVVLCAAAFLLFPLVSGYITGEVLSGGEASLQGRSPPLPSPPVSETAWPAYRQHTGLPVASAGFPARPLSTGKDRKIPPHRHKTERAAAERRPNGAKRQLGGNA